MIFGFVVAFPYIPGSSSDAFKGVSVFMGILLSLGSTSIISNIPAGYSMIYRRAYKLGDCIRIGEHVGDVVESRLLVTHLRTTKNEEIVLPNSLILGSSSVVNYSSSARNGDLILHSRIGIGYETSWRQVEAMLSQAASRTKGIKADPATFVLQVSLTEFCVEYEINVYCDNAQGMNAIYSGLHRNILDVFNEYGVQIMTPAYVTHPAQAKIVQKDKWYAPPAQPGDTRGMLPGLRNAC